MIYDEHEIYLNWKNAKNRKAQVRILAELNAVSSKRITDIILKKQKEEEERDAQYKKVLEEQAQKRQTKWKYTYVIIPKTQNTKRLLVLRMEEIVTAPQTKDTRKKMARM